MKKLQLLAFLIIGAAILTTSCKKDDDDDLGCNDFNYSQEVEQEATNFSEAFQQYSQNPTPENCQNYKNAATEYLDELERITDCVPTAYEEQHQNSLDEAQESIDDIEC